IISLIDRQRAVITAEDFWAGASYRTKLDPLSEADAFHRPVPGMHTVAELLSPVVAWRRDCMHKIVGDRPHPLKVDSLEDWTPNELLRQRGWDTLKQEFYDSADALCALLMDRDDAFLEGRPDGEERSFQFILDGLVDHD